MQGAAVAGSTTLHRYKETSRRRRLGNFRKASLVIQKKLTDQEMYGRSRDRLR
ncbi:MAG: hypothetical protein M3Z24_14855 [Chloroflexota bacterium]|nr:hypothetical protein [Chloroflexota bacterium]